jgi:hypothetical protein
MPCCASVRMTRLASQPTMPPTINQMMMFMHPLLCWFRDPGLDSR